MIPDALPSLRFSLLCILLAAGTLRAQRIDTIRANPAAVPLNKVWEVGGRNGDALGLAFYSLGDLFHRGRDVWFIGGSLNAQAQGLYRWDTATLTAQHIQKIPVGAFGGCSGRFFGGEQRYVVMTAGRLTDSPSVLVPRFHLYATDHDTLNMTVLSAWDGGLDTPIETSSTELLAASDLDGDGADELIALFPASIHPVFDSTGEQVNSLVDLHPRLWIYRGGPSFSLDSPTLVIVDSLQKSTNALTNRLIVGRFDDDLLPDIATIFEYRINGRDSSLLSLWTSANSSIWNWNSPNRRIPFPDAHTLGASLLLADLDGDNTLDALYPIEPFALGQHALFLSRTNGSFLQRLDSNQQLLARAADRILVNTPFDGAYNWGYISDSSNRYASIGFLRQGSYIGLSGGPNGPDPLWDATASGSNWQPIEDATGDGWSDLLAGYAFTGGNAGYAALYAGGPYIPHDPTVGVEWSPVAGEHPKAIAVWPHPATDLLHIAWRGDLQHPPRRFAIYDARGILVHQWEQLSPFRGEVVWNCSSQPAGNYTCTISDYHGTTLTSVAITVRH